MPAAEWRVARLATRRTDRGHPCPGRDGLRPGARPLRARVRRADAAARARAVRPRSSPGRARRSWPCSTARWRPSPSRSIAKVAVRAAALALRGPLRARAPRLAAPRRRPCGARRPDALAVLHLHRRDDRGRRRPVGAGRDRVHDRRPGRLRRHPAAPGRRRGRRRCSPCSTRCTRSSSASSCSSSSRCCGRPPRPSTPRRRRALAALRPRRPPARDRDRAGQGRRARARQRADDPALGGRGRRRPRSRRSPRAWRGTRCNRLDEAGAPRPACARDASACRCSSGGCGPRSPPSPRRSPCAS